MYHGVALAIEPGFEEEARRLLSEGRARGQALGDDWVVTPSSHYLGSIALRQRDYSLARKLTEEMLGIARELGDGYRDVAHFATSLRRSRSRNNRPTRRSAICGAASR